MAGYNHCSCEWIAIYNYVLFCSKHKPRGDRQPDGGGARMTMRLQITQSNFTIGEMGLICTYGMKWKLFTLMF